jgi:hypothetical protein
MGRLAIHPGDQLAEELKALDMSAAERASIEMNDETTAVAEAVNRLVVET